MRSALATLFGFYKEVRRKPAQKPFSIRFPHFLVSRTRPTTLVVTQEIIRQTRKENTSIKDTYLTVDEFLAYHILLQAHDVLLFNKGAAADGERVNGWEKVFLQVHRLLGYARRTIASRKEGEERVGMERGCQGALTQTRFALQVAKALAGGNNARFFRLCREGPQKRQGKDGCKDLLPTLVRCLLHKLLPGVRRRSLEVWSKVMFKKEKMPVGEVGRLLCLEKAENVVGFLTLHRLDVHRQGGSPGGGDNQGLDAWDSAAATTPSPSTSMVKKKCWYYEPRASSLTYLAVAQTIEDRRHIRGLLCPRQDAWVLEGRELGLELGEGEGEAKAAEGLAVLWEWMGLV